MSSSKRRVEDRHVGEERDQRPDLLRVPAPVAAPRRGGPDRAGQDAGDEEDRADVDVPVEELVQRAARSRRAAARRSRRRSRRCASHDADREDRVADHDDRHVDREPRRAGEDRRHRVDEAVDRAAGRRAAIASARHAAAFAMSEPRCAGARARRRAKRPTPQPRKSIDSYMFGGGDAARDLPARRDPPRHRGEAEPTRKKRDEGPQARRGGRRPTGRRATAAGSEEEPRDARRPHPVVAGSRARSRVWTGSAAGAPAARMRSAKDARTSADVGLRGGACQAPFASSDGQGMERVSAEVPRRGRCSRSSSLTSVLLERPEGFASPSRSASGAEDRRRAGRARRRAGRSSRSACPAGRPAIFATRCRRPSTIGSPEPAVGVERPARRPSRPDRSRPTTLFPVTVRTASRACVSNGIVRPSCCTGRARSFSTAAASGTFAARAARGVSSAAATRTSARTGRDCETAARAGPTVAARTPAGTGRGASRRR